MYLYIFSKEGPFHKPTSSFSKEYVPLRLIFEETLLRFQVTLHVRSTTSPFI